MTTKEATRDALLAALHYHAEEIGVDPRPKPSLRVGGMGHRAISIEKAPILFATVQRVLDIIRDSANTALSDACAAASYRGTLRCSVVTPLAEGADRLISQAADDAGWELGAILPMALADYEATFDFPADKMSAIAEFERLLVKAELPSGHGIFILDGAPSPDDERDRSYRNCASAIIQRCDFLLAIVDRTRMKSETGLSVSQARDLNLPIILIHPEHPETFRLILDGKEVSESLNQVQKLRAAVFDLILPLHKEIKDDDGNRRLRDYKDEDITYDQNGDCDFETAGPLSARTVAPLWISWCVGLNRPFRKRLNQYLTMEELGPKVESKPKAVSSDSNKKPARQHPPLLADELPFDANTAKMFVSLFLHFHRADKLADAYANLQRSSHILLGLLGISVAALSIGDIFWGMQYPVIMLAVLLVTCAIALVAYVSNHQRWLERWVEYRLLAETFRAAKFLLVSGRVTPFLLFKGRVQAHEPGNWVHDHAASVLRELKIAVPGRARSADPNALRKCDHYISAAFVEEQIRYSTRTAVYQQRLGKLFEAISRVIAVLVVFCVLIKVLQRADLLPLAGSAYWVPALSIVLTLLPAFGASLLAVRGYSQYEVVARRCKAMAALLASHAARASAPQDFHSLGLNTLSAVRIVLRDVDGWTDIFATRHLE